MICLNKKRCTGKYKKQSGMKGLLHHAGKRSFRGHKMNPRTGRSCLRRGEVGRGVLKRSVLFRSGRELVYLGSQMTGQRSLIDHQACFHPDKHWVDFHIQVSDLGSQRYEFEIYCYLDGKHWIDIVASNWIAIQQDHHGRWNCGDCMETSDPNAEPGYVKETFDSKQALLLDHLEATLAGIHYLCSHTYVNVWLRCPNNPGNTSSSVMLLDTQAVKECAFLIPIGTVKISPLKSNASETAEWVHNILSNKFESMRGSTLL